jgi:GT2 family glycosyltransferase
VVRRERLIEATALLLSEIEHKPSLHGSKERRQENDVSSKVRVILLNWNGWRDTVECLSSLQRLNYPNYRVIVVDNGSTDDSVSRIQEQFPAIELISTGRNLGFAGGCNVGISHSLVEGADYVWLLNNDTTVEPDALQRLIDKATSSCRIGAVGSAIYTAHNPEELDAWGGGRVDFWLGRSRHFTRPVRDEQIQFITGASILLPRTVIQTCGALDDGFFMYWEDAAYCFHLRAAGWRLAVAGESKVWHKGSASVGRGSATMDFYFNASAFRFFNRYSPVPWLIWVGVFLRIAKRLVLGDWYRARAVWVGATARGSRTSSCQPVIIWDADK